MKKLIILASFICLPSFAEEPINISTPESIEIERVQAEIDVQYAFVEYIEAMRHLFACLETEKAIKQMLLFAHKKIEEKKAEGIEISDAVITQIEKNIMMHLPDCKTYSDAVENAKMRLIAAEAKLNHLNAQASQK